MTALRRPLLLPLLLLLACGDGGAADEADCLGDLSATPGGLVLTPEEHPGWALEQCLSCHPANTFHQSDCLAEVAVDLDALAQIDPADPTACVSCHGGNGVPALEELAAAQDDSGSQDSGP